MTICISLIRPYQFTEKKEGGGGWNFGRGIVGGNFRSKWRCGVDGRQKYQLVISPMATLNESGHNT